jgi:hypothetical protein
MSPRSPSRKPTWPVRGDCAMASFYSCPRAASRRAGFAWREHPTRLAGKPNLQA